MQKFPLGKARGKQEGSAGENTVGKIKSISKNFWNLGYLRLEILSWEILESESGRKKINGKNAITENDLEKMHETMDELWIKIPKGNPELGTEDRNTKITELVCSLTGKTCAEKIVSCLWNTQQLFEENREAQNAGSSPARLTRVR